MCKSTKKTNIRNGPRSGEQNLIIHGESDRKVASEYGRIVDENLASPLKEIYLVPAAGHTDLARVGGPEYQSRILGFFVKYMVRTAPPSNERPELTE
jgi:hypothetical protein